MPMFQKHGYNNRHEADLDHVAILIEQHQLDEGASTAPKQRLVALRMLQDIDREVLPEGKRRLYDEYVRYVDRLLDDDGATDDK